MSVRCGLLVLVIYSVLMMLCGIVAASDVADFPSTKNSNHLILSENDESYSFGANAKSATDAEYQIGEDSQQYLPKVLAITVSGDIFSQTLSAIHDDIGEELIIVEKTVDHDTPIEVLAETIASTQPKLIILLGNAPVILYKKYQRQYPGLNFPPSITMSALHVDRLIPGIKNIVGIRYEVPAVTSLVAMRSLSNAPIKKVGVIYREWMDEQIELNRKLCAFEKIELVTVRLPNKVSFQKFSYHLKHLLDREDIDALWVVNDNALLSPRVIQNGWLPALRRFDKPVVVGTEGLTKNNLKFGTFTVIPDHYSMGIQGAGLIAELMENNWLLERNQVYHPIAIYKLLNLKLAKYKNIPIRTEKLGSVDVVLQ